MTKVEGADEIDEVVADLSEVTLEGEPRASQICTSIADGKLTDERLIAEMRVDANLTRHQVTNEQCTILRAACERRANISEPLLRAIVTANPEAAALGTASDPASLPLHALLANQPATNESMLRLLLDAHSVAAATADSSGALPLHLLLSSAFSAWLAEEPATFAPRLALLPALLERLVAAHPGALTVKVPPKCDANLGGKLPQDVFPFLDEFDDCRAALGVGSAAEAEAERMAEDFTRAHQKLEPGARVVLKRKGGVKEYGVVVEASDSAAPECEVSVRLEPRESAGVAATAAASSPQAAPVAPAPPALDPEGMSVKELKEGLRERGVDFTTFTEKFEFRAALAKALGGGGGGGVGGGDGGGGDTPAAGAKAGNSSAPPAPPSVATAAAEEVVRAARKHLRAVCANPSCPEAGAKPALSACLRCGGPSFCGAACLGAHWPQHKHRCAELVAAAGGLQRGRAVGTQRTGAGGGKRGGATKGGKDKEMPDAKLHGTHVFDKKTFKAVNNKNHNTSTGSAFIKP